MLLCEEVIPVTRVLVVNTGSNNAMENDSYGGIALSTVSRISLLTKST